jgi:osmotically-inducible protein OsmY
MTTENVPRVSGLRDRVQAELSREPSINSISLGVAVEGDVVVLTGHTRSLFEKWTAETAAQRVEGVVAVANEIQVDIPATSQRTDGEIAEAVLDALKWDLGIPSSSVRVSVDDGHVTLDGYVEWDYQVGAAMKALIELEGVRSVTDLLVVRPEVTPDSIKEAIFEALKRTAVIDAERISVRLQGGTTVTLRGRVRSWAEREDAVKAAAAFPGVTEVRSELVIGP